MREEASRFNINVTRELFIHGEAQYEQLVRKLIKGLTFVNPRSARDETQGRAELHFFVAAADFTASRQVLEVVRVLESLTSPLVHKIAFVVAPEDPAPDVLLLLQELGVRHVACGVRRNEDLRDHVKRVCLEKHQVGSLEAYETDIEDCRQRLDMEGMRATIMRLKVLPQTEDVLRLIAIASLQVGDMKRAESTLRQILQVNSQNLWAANTLGKLYLRSGRAALGVEVLRRLSQFHDLNAERLLTLGNAATLTGQRAVAEEALRKGDRLTGGVDERFKEGLAKLRLENHDLKGALVQLAGRGFTPDMVSFLNMRAIMATRAGRIDEGLQFYAHAESGVAEADKELRAKIKFNVGLAHVRAGNLDKAEAALAESAALGGTKFTRAGEPLVKLRAVIKNGGKSHVSEAALLGELDYETLY